MVFPSAFVISQERPDNNPAQNPAAVAPVVYPRKDQSEYEEADHPAAYLAVDRTAIGSAPAFSVEEQGADQAADRCRGTDGEWQSGQVGDHVPYDAAQGVDAEHAAAAVFVGNPGSDLFQGHHVENDVQYAAVQIIGAEQRPEPAEMVDRVGAGCAQTQQTGLTG